MTEPVIDIDWTPAEDRILVKVDETAKTSAGGVIMPDAAVSDELTGVVIAVGPGRFSEYSGSRIPIDVREGDRVMFAPFGGVVQDFDGHELLILRPADVIATHGKQMF